MRAGAGADVSAGRCAWIIPGPRKSVVKTTAASLNPFSLFMAASLLEYKTPSHVARLQKRLANLPLQSSQHQRCTKSGIKVSIAKSLLQRRKRGLAGAVPRRDILYFESISQGRNDIFNVRIARH